MLCVYVPEWPKITAFKVMSLFSKTCKALTSDALNTSTILQVAN